MVEKETIATYMDNLPLNSTMDNGQLISKHFIPCPKIEIMAKVAAGWNGIKIY